MEEERQDALEMGKEKEEKNQEGAEEKGRRTLIATIGHYESELSASAIKRRKASPLII